MQYDLFNGDADGICALHLLRLAQPCVDSRLVTGVKRDNQLVGKLFHELGSGLGPEDSVAVLDVSLDKNRDDLLTLLARGCRVFFVDHHYAGDIPRHQNLTIQIDCSADVCTSILIDRLQDGRHRAWAVAAAFGDNLHGPARVLASGLGLDETRTSQLRELGELMNYNGYGETVADLHVPPDELYRAVRPYADPFAFLQASSMIGRLREGFQQDMAEANRHPSIRPCRQGRMYEFPAEKWAKRVAGVFSNEKAREKPDLAHALVVDNGDGTYLVSVRAPLSRKTGADVLCRQFPTGGGRAAAAGINALPAEMLERFVDSFCQVFAKS